MELGAEKSPGEVGASFPIRAAVDRRRVRPIYRHSVIRGGVYSPGELREALLADPVAAKHYADFHSGAAEIVAAPQAQLLYASYRIDNRVYWTRRPLEIPAGEALISDGENLARARCGNRLSPKPQQPITRSEPSEAELDEQDPSDDDMASSLLRDLPIHRSALAFDYFAPTLLTLTDDGMAEAILTAKSAQAPEKDMWPTLSPEFEVAWTGPLPLPLYSLLANPRIKSTHAPVPTVGTLMPIGAALSWPVRSGATLPPFDSHVGIYGFTPLNPPTSPALLPLDGEPQSALTVEPPQKFEPFPHVPGTPQTQDEGSTPLPEPWSESLVCLGLAAMVAWKRLRI